MKGDIRAGRVALVADAVMNPAPGGADPMALLLAGDWGVIGLPPERLGEAAIGQWIAGAVDQADELRRHGMTVVAVLDGRDAGVNAALEAALDPAVPRLVLENDEASALERFLDDAVGD